MSVLDGIDTSDPCAVWPRLQEVLYRLEAGEAVVESRFGDEEVKFRAPQRESLRASIAELKARCEAERGGKRQRYAMRARMHRRPLI